MRFHKRIYRPSIRQNTAIAYRNSIIHNSYLYQCAIHITIMCDGIIYSLADSFSCKRVFFDLYIMLIPNFCFQIPLKNQINHLACIYNKRFFKVIMIDNPASFIELPNLYKASVLNNPWITIKQKDCRPFQFSVCHHLQLLKQFLVENI